jgi:hypothetical protein
MGKLGLTVGPVITGDLRVNRWNGTKSPAWQKPGAREDRGKPQKQIRRAFEASKGEPLSPHELMAWCTSIGSSCPYGSGTTCAGRSSGLSRAIAIGSRIPSTAVDRFFPSHPKLFNYRRRVAGVSFPRMTSGKCWGRVWAADALTLCPQHLRCFVA